MQREAAIPRGDSRVNLYAIDIETECAKYDCDDNNCKHALDPYSNRITVIGVSDGLFDEQVFRDLTKFNKWVKDNPSIRFTAHNGKFDFKNLIVHGIDYSIVHKWIHDSSLLAFTSQTKISPMWLDTYEERRRELNKRRTGLKHRVAREHSLKTLAPYFLGVEPFWEPEQGHDSDEYVLKDVQYTLQLTNYFLEKLDNKSLQFYTDKFLPWTKNLLSAELEGVFIDKDLLAEMWDSTEEKKLTAKEDLTEKWRIHFEEWNRLQRIAISNKYREMEINAISKIKGEHTFEKLFKIKQRYKVLEQKALDRGVEEFNLDSPAQLLWLLKDRLGLDPHNLDGEESTDKETLNRLSLDNPDVALLLDYRKAVKLCSTYFPEYLDAIHEGKIHATFNPTNARTGRLSCIEENQLIETPTGQKRIKDINVGDLVYSYTDDNKVTIKKVLKKFDNGLQECIKLKIQSSGDGRILELVCTPDHRIKHKYKGWMEAKDLSRHDKLLHVRRELLSSGRIRVYSSNKGQELEESIIKREVFGASSGFHIHHIDGNKSNNSLDNLTICTAKGHNSLHSIKDDYLIKKPALKKLQTRLGFIKALAKVKGQITRLDADYNSVIATARVHNLSIKSIAKRYSASGIYLNKNNILSAMEARSMEEAAKHLAIGTRKLKALCWKYGITYNHAMVSKQTVGLRRVYDLEIEDTHNFIASEICVHNCQEPNLQQVPGDLHDVFIAQEGSLLVTRDLSAIEPTVLAFYSEDPELCRLMINKGDFHSTNAHYMFELECDVSEVKKRYDLLRKVAKTVGLAVLYGAGANQVLNTLKRFGLMKFTHDDARRFVKRIRDLYAGVWEFKTQLDKELEKGAIIYNLMGRPLKIQSPQDVYMQGLNTLIQSSASDLLQQAALDVKTKLGVQPLLLVHDEMVVQVPDDGASDTWAKNIEQEMTKFELKTQYGLIPIRTEGKTSKRWEK